MTITYKDQSVNPLPLASANTVYTAGSINSGKIDQCSAFNTTSSNVTLTATVNGGQYVNRIIPANRELVLTELINKTLKTGYVITFTPSVASAINLSLSIKEITT